MIINELFAPGITHIEVRCCDCGHTVVRKPDQVPAVISQHEFERRSVWTGSRRCSGSPGSR
ncbi:hypothetical protein GCM10016455_32890 [Aliiroseovarius zhejiangensis]|uniref:Uncharacterized protein n=1 Tax=Aliiroseovarius zhejiangensis TaxID=1632025 RepID=A0ABQ3J8W2_9RHOB|nr:hypothetical protein [Aliiroseovarius zhejiangensis]GHF09468.1 hypothetical protein GCM10016455_32890 [Aliiroseovarius zhejiangensis]